MTEQEAREKAEAWALARLARTDLDLKNISHSSFIGACVDAYTSCWRDMHSGEPDGWMVKGNGDNNRHLYQVFDDKQEAMDAYSGDCWDIIGVKLLKVSK